MVIFHFSKHVANKKINLKKIAIQYTLKGTHNKKSTINKRTHARVFN